MKLIVSLLFIFPMSLYAGLSVDSFKTLPFLDEDLEKPNWIKRLYPSEKGIFDWTPRGTSYNTPSKNCHFKSLERKILNAKSTESMEGAIQNHFRECNDELVGNNSTGIGALLKLGGVEYPLFKNPHVKKVSFKLSNGDITFGYLGMKPNKKRPMIIVKCGLLCEGNGSPSTLIFFSHLFDESPFHVLILGSQSGANSMVSNKRVMFGGFYESQEVIAMAEWLKESEEYKSKISSYHFFGSSLGGSSTFFTSLYENSFNSLFAFCPVVNLKASTYDLYEEDIFGSVFGSDTWDTLKQGYGHVPGLSEVMPQRPYVTRYPGILGYLGAESISRLDLESYPKYFDFTSQIDADKFWEINNFTNYSDYMKMPLFTLTSKDDPMVEYENNAGALKNKLNKRGKGDSVLGLKEGSHCASSISYGWKSISALLRSYFVRHSPELIANKKEIKLNLSKYILDDLVGTNWRYYKRSNRIKVEFIYPDMCDTEEEFGNRYCYATLDRYFSAKDILKQIPEEYKTDVGLERWMNTNLTINDQGNAEFIDWN